MFVLDFSKAKKSLFKMFLNYYYNEAACQQLMEKRRHIDCRFPGVQQQFETSAERPQALQAAGRVI